MISILVIGNEILSAQVRDLNLSLMLPALNRAGYQVDEVRMVVDDVDVIAGAVRDLSERSDYVISCGGVGPTHDDVTMRAYAKAFGVPLIRHPELEKLMRDYYGDALKPEKLIMAEVPENASLAYGSATRWPAVMVANCFVLPGLPEIFRQKFDIVLAHLPAVGERFYAALEVRLDESDFAGYLTDLQIHFEDVEIGSYPVYDRRLFAARITLKGRCRDRVDSAYQALLTYFFEFDNAVAGERPVEIFDPAALQ